MQYYSLHYAIKNIGRGGYPQVQDIELEEGRKVDDHDFVWQLRGDNFPEFKPYIGTLILQKGSSVTDFISSSMVNIGFVCSDKARNIVEEQKLGKTNFYELTVRHKDINYQYQLMHCINNYIHKVDFERSVFHILRIENNKKVGKIQPISSLEEYVQLYEQVYFKNKNGDYNFLEPITVRFKDGFKPEHDIFLIWGITYKTYVSERLKAAFEKHKVTGVTFDFDGEHTDFE